MFGYCYEMPPYRPPSEAASLLFRLVRGCPWNRCTFCCMYRDLTFQIRPVEDLMKEMDMAWDFYGEAVKTAFLGDSDPLVHRDLLQILDYLSRVFPSLERVTAYARIKTILRLSLSQLKSIAQSGLTRLHIGLESGSPRVLKNIKKGPSPQEMVEGTCKAREAGLEVSLYVLVGIGGVDYSQEHAQKTAGVINQSSPEMVRLRTLSPRSGTPLAQDVKGGFFQELSPVQRMQELRSLVSGIGAHTLLYSDHITNALQTRNTFLFPGVEGRLPDDKERMIKELDRVITLLQENPQLQEEILSPRSL